MRSSDPDIRNPRWIIASVAGLLIFLFIQVFPITGKLFTADKITILDRASAVERARAIAELQFGIAPNEIVRAEVTYLSEHDAVSYLNKHQLLKDYEHAWAEAAPTDYYRVDLQVLDKPGILQLSLHMETGRLVAWHHNLGRESAGFASEQDIGLDTVKRALAYAEGFGIPTADWTWSGQTAADGSFVFASDKTPIGESEQWLRVRLPQQDKQPQPAIAGWFGGSVTYGMQLPSDFAAYLDRQEKLAGKLSLFGYLLPQLLLMVAAIIYTGTYGGQTSYRRGLFLASVYFACYAAYTFNVLPALRADALGSHAGASGSIGSVALITSLVIYAVMALFTYLSAVAGDGLWKSMRYSLWPRWQEANYGARVMSSMRTGYFLAFILLGAQSIILLGLEQLVGAFATTDPSQSLYNMSYAWLLPLLAWCAGISEELQSRFFGIGLFRRWLLGLANKLLGRAPSARTVSVLTFAAMLPPGLLWAFGHVGYAVYPVYTRLIELVLMAMLFGWFMMRFGLMTVIFAHVTLNSILMGIQLMFGGLPGGYASGIASLLAPYAVAAIIWLLHQRLRKPVQIA